MILFLKSLDNCILIFQGQFSTKIELNKNIPYHKDFEVVVNDITRVKVFCFPVHCVLNQLIYKSISFFSGYRSPKNNERFIPKLPLYHRLKIALKWGQW